MKKGFRYLACIVQSPRELCTATGNPRACKSGISRVSGLWFPSVGWRPPATGSRLSCVSSRVLAKPVPIRWPKTREHGLVQPTLYQLGFLLGALLTVKKCLGGFGIGSLDS